jgi:hypothetical protein
MGPNQAGHYRDDPDAPGPGRAPAAAGEAPATGSRRPARIHRASRIQMPTDIATITTDPIHPCADTSTTPPCVNRHPRERTPNVPNMIIAGATKHVMASSDATHMVGRYLHAKESKPAMSTTTHSDATVSMVNMNRPPFRIARPDVRCHRDESARHREPKFNRDRAELDGHEFNTRCARLFEACSAMPGKLQDIAVKADPVNRG